MQFSKFTVSLFALAAISAALPSPQNAQSVVRIGHADPTASAPEVISAEESSIPEESSVIEESSIVEESSVVEGDVESSEDIELSEDENDVPADDGTSTIFVSGEVKTVLSETSEKSSESSSSGAESFRGISSVVTLAVAGGVSLMLAAF
ncbi:hypothetical protein BX661DRAFT_89843 [Kickxella alabastrina]|uniref:uncharacterized protein n=1 Tax=Kickxella alabastrina TaxID=61397 RepID=UPI0022207C46|nr:uncharacterized protein BX661DRAFT_89843 [Kickxella alabastrina]KAI7830861.1 hypothetical protein BX661DRAFT_89843 [Kickxella alabastrina]